MKRKVGAERRSIVVGDIKPTKKKRKLPAAMISYVKPRRKRRLLSVSDVRSDIKDFSVKSAGTDVTLKPANAEITGRLTSASIVSRYRHLDQQRSKSRRMSGRLTSSESGTRPSTRSQTAAVMHRELVMARMKSHEDMETKVPQQRGVEMLAETDGVTLRHTSSMSRRDPSPRSQTSEQRALSPESLARQSSLAVKKEVLDGDESERSMRRFIRRRNVEASDANRGSSDVSYHVCSDTMHSSE